MWYFSWILGIGAALAFGIINVMWLESQRTDNGSSRRAID
jgi:cyd operon protein YbgT